MNEIKDVEYLNVIELRYGKAQPTTRIASEDNLSR
jgi:hypothetical protein